MFKDIKNLPNQVKVEDKYIGKGASTFMIADMGANHNGDYYLAKKLIEEAKLAGADAVKLQKRHVNEVATRELLEREQTKDQIFGKTYKEYRENLELNEEEYVKLKRYADSLGIIFFATPFDIKSVDFLEKIGVGVYKIASQDQTHLPLLEHVAKKGKPVIISLGASEWEEADEAVETILKYNNQLIIQYCVSIYPSPDESLRMATLLELKRRYAPLPVGYSGHERDILPSLAAVALGADSIERHFTLDKALPGPDHATVSIEREELAQLVKDTRRLEKILGEPAKQIWQEEIKFRDKHGVSLVSARAIPAGAVITEDMLTVKSPGYGLKPRLKDKVIGKRTVQDIEEDVVIVAEFIEELN